MRILLVEDDEILIQVLQQTLAEQRYVVDIATDGRIGLDYAQSATYDLILMDVGLPKLDGISLCQQLRSHGCTTPILMITAKEEKRDRIRGLDAGADDYLVKPLDLAEVQARVRALLRRGEVAPNSVLQVGNLSLDPRTCQVSYGTQPIALTPKEYSLLELFLRNPSRVFSRGHIIEHLWTFDDPPMEDIVKAHIKGLRQKLKAVGAVDWIENVYGLGYRLREDLASLPDSALESAPAKSPSVADALEDKQSSSPIPQAFDRAKEALWQQSQGLMTQRVTLLQQMAVALQTDQLSSDLQQAAAQAAHKLAGVLGMFDRDVGSEIARALEQRLTDTRSPYADAEQLIQWVQHLSQIIHAEPPSLPESPATLSVAPSPNSPTSPTAPLNLHILMVDDDPLFCAALRPMLQPWGIQLTALEDPLQFWDTVPIATPDLLILDVEMPQLSGIELCQAVRADSRWQNLPILVITAYGDRHTIQQVFAAGADDYITKPIVAAELITRITNRLERNRLLQTLSNQDLLTKLSNQAQSSRTLETLLQQQAIAQQSLCLVVLSLTEMRTINRQYGHSVGNQVLQHWGQILQSEWNSISGLGVSGLGYWGNGEFVVGLPGNPDQIADSLARVSLLLRQQVFTATDHSRFQVEFGIGIAEFPHDGTTLHALYQCASERSQYSTTIHLTNNCSKEFNAQNAQNAQI